MNIDTSRLRADCAHGRAERLGREQALKDIDKLGFGIAYNQSQVLDGGMRFLDPAAYFMAGYRQAVLGYWLAGLVETKR